MAANARNPFDAAKKTTATLQNLPFDQLIGAPLNACVKAQAEAAQTTINFINEIGLEEEIVKTTDETGKEVETTKKKAVYVYFNFIQGGRRVTISVPLLTMVPIPYIAINTIDINFKATVTGTQTEENKAANEQTTDVDKKTKSGKLGWFSASTTTLNTNVSTKKDSVSTKNSAYSVEATIDVAVHASQDSMPAGMAKVLEMLGSAMDLCDPNGELTVNETNFELAEGENEAKLIVLYKTPEGVYDPSDVYIKGVTPEIDTVAGTATFKLKGSASGETYTVVSKTSPRTINVKVKTI